MNRFSLLMFGSLMLTASLVFLFAVKNNASYNTCAAVLFICILLACFRGKRSLGVPPRMVLLGYGAILAGIIVPSLVLGGANVEKAIHYLFLTFSFWLAFYGVRVFGSPSIRMFPLVALVSAGVILYVYIFNTPPNFQRFALWYDQPNQTGSVCIISLIFALLGAFAWQRSLKWQVLSALGAVVILGGVVLSGSRGAASGFIAGGVTVLILSLLLRRGVSFRRLATATAVSALLILVAVLGAFIYSFADKRHVGDLTRIKIYKTSAVMWQEHPIFGVGYANYENSYRDYMHRPDTDIQGNYDRKTVFKIAHNDFMEMLSTCGIVGAAGYVVATLAFALFLLRMFYYRRGDMWSMAALWLFLAIWLRGMVDDGIYFRYSWWAFWGMLGVMAALSVEKDFERNALPNGK